MTVKELKDELSYRKATLIKLYELLDRLEQELCDDCISRQEVLDLCDSKDPDYKVIHFKEDVECLPSVNPQPKTGYWIFCEGIKGKDNVERCSCCQSHWKEAVIYRSDTQEYLRLRLKYCPNCGAKMQEAK